MASPLARQAMGRTATGPIQAPQQQARPSQASGLAPRFGGSIGNAVRGNGRVAGPSAGVAGAAPAPAAGPGVPAAPYTAVDTSRTDKIYDDMLAKQNEMWGNTQQMIQQNWSGQLRHNASNAARMGLSLGGASYLAGNRAANVAGANNAMQMQNQAWAQQQGIMGGQANVLAGAQNTNANNQNAAGVATWQRGNEVDDRKTEAQAERNANANVAAVQDIKNKFDYLFNKHNYAAGGGQYNTLLSQYEAALGQGTDREIADAYNALMAYVTPFQQAREAWLKWGGEKGGMSFEEFWKKRQGDFL